MIHQSGVSLHPGITVRAGPSLVVAYLLAHVALDSMSFVQPVLKLGITPLSPQTGLALAFLLAYPRGVGWVVLALLVSEVVIRGVPSPAWVLLLHALGVAAVYASAAHIMQRIGVAGIGATLSSTLRFIVAAAVTALAAALVGVGVYTAFGPVPQSMFGPALARYAVGDFNGILLLTPLLLRLPAAGMLASVIRQQPVAFTGVLLGIVGALTLVFLIGDPQDLRFFYLLFIPAIAAALTWGVPGFLLAAVALQAGLILGVQRLPEVAPLLDLQLLMSILLATGLALGAVITERHDSARSALQREIELRSRETSLARASRVALTGELASTLAHELNQPLTALVGYLRAGEIMVGERHGGDPRLAPTLRKAANEALRASDTLRRLRNFYAGRDPQLEPLLMQPLLAQIIDTLRHSDRVISAEIRVTPIDSGMTVYADRVFVGVILANLLTNALDATDGRPTRSVEIDATVSGGLVRIVVDDDGGGIPSPVHDELFKAFVTSKPDGMGVGLAVSRSLAEACGGSLTLGVSSLGGACFVLSLPTAALTGDRI
jgi:two-component system, LuxR family, sensor kinase FixL